MSFINESLNYKNVFIRPNINIFIGVYPNIDNKKRDIPVFPAPVKKKEPFISKKEYDEVVSLAYSFHDTYMNIVEK